MKKVLVLLAKGFEEIEAVTVIDILRRAHVKVHICSIDKEFVEGSHGITIKSDVRLEYIDINKDIYETSTRTFTTWFICQEECLELQT